jgi:hypothetical protein
MTMATFLGGTLLLGTACGRSPFVLGDDEDDKDQTQGPDTSTTEPPETAPPETEDDETEDDETDGENFVITADVGGEDPLTCREILECMMGCIADLGLDCLGACAEGADPAEAVIAGELLTCVAGLCIDNGQCTVDNITSEDCIGCLGLGLFVPEPPGCEEQGMACQ